LIDHKAAQPEIRLRGFRLSGFQHRQKFAPISPRIGAATMREIMAAARRALPGSQNQGNSSHRIITK
jgi:hypothetical protein